MTIEEQAKDLERSLNQLEGLKRKPWLTADDRRAVVQDIQRQIRSAEQTLSSPTKSPDETYNRQWLILFHELAVGTLKAPEYQ